MGESVQNLINWVKEFLKGQIPFTNPVLILSVVLLIILFAPLVFKRFKIPGIIGLILAGVIIGPNTFHLIDKTTSFELFSKTGLLYIMFLAGLEIDMQEFRQNRSKSMVFGALTFFIPIIIGFLVCTYIFHFQFWAAVLLASMFSTHTLLSYPIVSSMGVVKNRAVQLTFGGTIITDTAVLILLGIITNVVENELSPMFWIKTIVLLAALVVGTLYILPIVTRWFFRNLEGQGSSQYIYVLAVVFLAAFSAEVSGVEPIIGAFLAGLALNRVIPHNSVLMNRVVFIGNTLFIPFFLISAGMLVDIRLFFTGTGALIFAGILSFVALLTKYLAAKLTGIFYKFSKAETRIIFGLSASHAAATLAVIKVGFDIGLFDKNVINGTIILILITCLVSSFVTERAARELAITEKDKEDTKTEKRPERILVPITNPDSISRLIELALLIKNQRSNEAIFPLSIVDDDTDADMHWNNSKRTLENIVEQVAAVDKKVEILRKVDLNITDGIVRTAKAYGISDIVLGYQTAAHSSNFIFGSKAEQLVDKTEQLVVVSKIVQPLNSFKNVIVVLTPNAELEKNFKRTCLKINRVLKQVGNEAFLYGEDKTLVQFQLNINDKSGDMYKYVPVESFEEMSFLDNHHNNDELYIILNARKQTVSYNYHIDNLPRELHKNFEYCSFIVFYPEAMDTLSGNQYNDVTSVTVQESVDKIIKVKDKITGIFKKDN
ncbi:MAG: cation:proton antiporter [Bacteroidetes bacterium]|jgi:Kef-type K+ transport system membrane component KefB/nucleotide-binding universal stress UspA family protein|nr:cation:proton antiporter [Bacteroidota bacterium]